MTDSEKIEEIVSKYVDFAVTREIQFPSLIQELKDYGTQFKAWEVHRKCVRAGKIELANRIARKYRIGRSDMTAAAMYAIMASKQ